MLVKAGANVNIKDTEGNTAENLAHIAGHQGVYEYLKQIQSSEPLKQTAKLRKSSRIQFSSDDESQSDFTKVSNQAPIPRAAPPNKLNPELKSDSEVSWKSSNSSLTESHSEEENSKHSNEENQTNRASLRPTQVDFRQIMSRFNSKFSEEFQEFGASQELKETSEWDSSASFQPSVEEKKENAVDAQPEADSSKWDDSSQSSSQHSSLGSKAKETNAVKNEESVEKPKSFYSKTGASQEAIEHGLGLPVSGAVTVGSRGSVQDESKGEDESKWDTSDNVSRVISDNPEPVVHVTDVSQWDSDDDSDSNNSPIKMTHTIEQPANVEASLPKNTDYAGEQVSNWDSEPLEAKQIENSKISDQSESLGVSIPKNKPGK